MRGRSGPARGRRRQRRPVARIVKRNKALSVNPLKASQTIGAALAFLGIERAIPMLHGSQGCTAFGKVFFVRHFREPIPLQTTAIDQISAVMGAEDSIVEGLETIARKSSPDLIGIPTTGLAETQGSDVERAVKAFRAANPDLAYMAVVPVATPDFAGCLETGFAKATQAMIDVLVPHEEGAARGGDASSDRVNVLVGASLTPGDIETLKALIEAFGLLPKVLPDLSDSLDGRLTEADFSPLTIGGFDVTDFAGLGTARATLVIGASMHAAADLLAERTGVPDRRFDHVMGLAATDALVHALHELAGRPVPHQLEKQRAQLQDAMLDTHFMLGLTPIAVALDPDLVKGFADLLTSVGAEVAAAVAPANAPVLPRVPTETVKIGDLQDLESIASDNGVELMIGNSHAVTAAERLGVPILRAGFPQYDILGGFQRCWIGYRGSAQALFDLANLMLATPRGEIAPYKSIYAQKPEYWRSVDHDVDPPAQAR